MSQKILFHDGLNASIKKAIMEIQQMNKRQGYDAYCGQTMKSVLTLVVSYF